MSHPQTLSDALTGRYRVDRFVSDVCTAPVPS
jgi:hypothetical protein